MHELLPTTLAELEARRARAAAERLHADRRRAGRTLRAARLETGRSGASAPAVTPCTAPC